MGRSWRIGIDTGHATDLVTSGLFALSRNPIFLAMRVCLAILVLVRPNAFTLALWLVGDVIMQVQVRLEESFLQQLGADYLAYCERSRRWIWNAQAFASMSFTKGLKNAAFLGAFLRLATATQIPQLGLEGRQRSDSVDDNRNMLVKQLVDATAVSIRRIAKVKQDSNLI